MDNTGFCISMVGGKKQSYRVSTRTESITKESDSVASQDQVPPLLFIAWLRKTKSLMPT